MRWGKISAALGGRAAPETIAKMRETPNQPLCHGTHSHSHMSEEGLCDSLLWGSQGAPSAYLTPGGDTTGADAHFHDTRMPLRIRYQHATPTRFSSPSEKGSPPSAS